jgi:Tol biopolymer transport system component
VRAAWLMLLLGCGRADFDELRAPVDSAPIDGITDVAPVQVCDPATPFGTPVPVAGVNVTGSYDSTFVPTLDELTAYFYSDRAVAGDYDIYRATRPDLTSAWTVTHISELASTNEEKEPSISPDGKVLAFTSNRAPNVGGDDLWYATYDGTAFTVVGPIAQFETAQTDYHPLFQAAGDQFWFSSNISGVFQIFHASHSGTTFGAASVETELDDNNSNNGAAAPSPDGLTMYFRSDRGQAAGDYDIFVARRTLLTDPFGTPTAVGEVNSASLDTPNWISPDGCRLYLSSSRDDASDIYVATKQLP